MTDQPRDDDFDALIAEGIERAEAELPRASGDDEPIAVVDEQDADEDAPLQAPGLPASGPEFEVDEATFAAAVAPFVPVEAPGPAPTSETPPANGWSLSQERTEPPTVQMDVAELRAELAAASQAPLPDDALAREHHAVAPAPELPPQDQPRLGGLAAAISARARAAEPSQPEPAKNPEAAPVPTPEPEPEPAPAPAPEPEPEPEPESEPAPARRPERQLQPERQPAPAPVPEPQPALIATPASAPLTAPATDDPLALAAIERVRRWLDRPAPANPDKATERLAALLNDAAGLDFAIGFVDRVVRPEDPKVGARNLEALSRDIPDFLDWHLKLGITVGGGFGIVTPKLVMPLVKRAMREMVSHLVIDATPARLGKQLAKLREDGTLVSVELLGDAVLGDEEAASRLEETAALLRRDDVEHVSISLPALAPPMQPWAFDERVDRVVEALLPLYRFAAESSPSKSIDLDAGMHRDRDLTIAVFERLLTRPELARFEAGIAVQAYLPDALSTYRRLAAFAKERRANGGAGIKVRLVKGAHLAMERVEAALHGWPPAVVASKAAADANFKRVLLEALLPEHAFAVRLGIASHNLFDLAYAAEVARRNGTHQRIDAEMLLGIATDHRAAVHEDFPRLILSTPVVRPGRLDAAVPYLVRRLEEHASGEHFLASSADLADAAVFQRERDRFLASLELQRAEDAAGGPRPSRTQDRLGDLAVSVAHPDGFCNEPDTDPSLAANRDWARQIVQRAADSQLGLRTLELNRIDDWPTLERRIDKAAQAADGWAAQSAEHRAAVLRDAAETLGVYRGRLVEVMLAETGSTLAEADPEVSAAIDFARLCAEQAPQLERLDDARPRPAQLTVVTPPWSSPVAVPCGGVTAALATGSSVILKPAPQARRSAAVLCEALWEAGVPREVLVLCDVPEGDVARQLVTHPAVGRVVLTGSSRTAELFASWRSDLPLLAETGGKGSIVVTPSADLELAAADIAQSAFVRAGQTPSAASVVILVDTAGDSERFRQQLVDAVSSLRVGSPLDARTQIGPLVEPASGALLRALTSLEDDEEWLLEPRKLDASGRLWSPGIRDAVLPGSFTHVTELFGPHVSLIEVDTLEEAIEAQNAIEHGLTAGLHSFDPDEVEHWLAEVQAGNLYVNRGTTGAIVRRQPSGGWKLSQTGPGTKAGGPNHLAALVDWQPVPSEPKESVRLHGLDKRVAELIEAATPALDFLEFDRVRAGANSDQSWWEEEFGLSRDVAALGVERSILRYRPAELLIRLAEDGQLVDLVRLLAAAARSRAVVRISSAVEVPSGVVRLSQHAIPHVRIEETVEETDAAFRERIRSGEALEPVQSEDALGLMRVTEPVRRIRLVGTDAGLREALAGNVRVAVYDGPVTTEGRIELLPFLREQSVSIAAHRFGMPEQAMLALPV